MAHEEITRLREAQVRELAKFKNSDPTEDDLKEARENMGELYQLNQISRHIAHTFMCTKQNVKLINRQREKLDRIFHKTYNLHIVPESGPVYFACTVDENGAVFQEINMYF